MNRLVFNLKRHLKKVEIASLLVVTALGLSTMILQPKAQAAVSFGGPFNCDANAVLWCGGKDTSTILNDYNNGDGHSHASSIQYIYSQFGINRTDVENLGTTAVAGSVTKSGDVYVGSQLVATNAMTAGRENIAGSTKVSYNGVTFYKRAPSVSFQDNSLTAYVVMQNGQFKFAILSSCGNPVSATPKTPSKGALACSELLTTPGTIESNGDQSYTFTAKASASNATISKYVFNLGNGHSTQTINTTATSATSNTQVYAPGSYTVSATVSGVAENNYTSAPSSVTCTKQFTVQPNGTLTCSSLALNEVGTTNTTTGDVTYTLTAQATAKNAAITKYVFMLGNGSSQTVTTTGETATSQSVTYAAGQTYPSIFVTVYGTSNNNGAAISAGGAGTPCATNLKVPSQTCATGSQSSSCQPTCTAPNGQTYPAGSSSCLPTTPTPPTTPASTVLPNTGAGNVIGLFAIASILGGLGYRSLLNRRLARR